MLNYILLAVFFYCFVKVRSIAWILLYANIFIFVHHFFIARFKFKFNASAMYMFFGLPGSGKSTVCAEIVRQIMIRASLKNINVYCNFPVTGSLEINRDEIGCYELRDELHPKSVLLVDEASTVYWKRDSVSRDSKKRNFTEDSNKFFSLHRHYLNMPIFFAQSWDGVDIRIRELSTKLFYVEHSRIKNFIKIRQIAKIFTIDENHQPSDGYDFVKFSSRYVWAPRCWKMFDSYIAPDLEKKEWKYWNTAPIVSRKFVKTFPIEKLFNIFPHKHVSSEGESGGASPDTQEHEN